MSSVRKNVLLLALSTFGDMLESEYIFDNGAERYSGGYKYQLEPVPQIIAKRLERRQDSIDRIIVLCSSLCRVPDDVRGEGLSPLEYFVKATTPYVNPENNQEECFVVVDLDENDPSQGIFDAVSCIRGLSGESPINLYLDTHGGPRGIQLILESIISLLKTEGVFVNSLYSVITDKNRRVVQVLENSQEFRMFDFVSGINEFINYGRIDSLDRYFSQEKDVDEDTKELLSIMRGMADSIQMCDVGVFEYNVNKLRSFFKAEKGSETKNYLSIFFKTIEKDYAPLLSNNGNKFLSEVEWCMKKGFYQQCLTIIESRLPGVLYESGVMVCDNDVNVYVESGIATIDDIFNTCTRNAADFYKIDDKISTTSKRLKALKNLSRDNRDNGLKLSKFDCPLIRANAIIDSKPIGNVEFCYKDMQKLFEFLVLHKALKELRNTSNHAATGRVHVSADALCIALELYVRMGREILKKEEPELDDDSEATPITEENIKELMALFGSKRR